MNTTAMNRRGVALLSFSLALFISLGTGPVGKSVVEASERPSGPSGALASRHVVTVNRSQTFQTFVAWESTAAIFGAGQPWYPEVRDDVAQRAAELGVSQLRLEVRDEIDDGAGHYDWTEFDAKVVDVVRPMADALLQVRGETLKVNVCNVSFGSGAVPNHPHRTPSRFGAFARAAVDRAVNYHHLSVAYFEICLEPDNASGNTCFNSPLRIAQSVNAVRSALNAGGFSNVKIIAPSCVNTATARNWINTLRNQYPSSYAKIDLLSYHRYTSSATEVVTEIGNVAQTTGKKSGMTEYLSGTSDHLYKDLLYGQVSVWQKYGIAGSADTMPYMNAPLFRVEDDDPSNIVVHDAAHTPALRQYYSNIRPGAVRVGTSAAPNPVSATAWINPGNKLAVVVEYAGVPIDVAGLTNGNYQVTYVRNGLNVDGGIFTVTNGRLSLNVPLPVGPLTVREL